MFGYCEDRSIGCFPVSPVQSLPSALIVSPFLLFKVFLQHWLFPRFSCSKSSFSIDCFPVSPVQNLPSALIVSPFLLFKVFLQHWLFPRFSCSKSSFRARGNPVRTTKNPERVESESRYVRRGHPEGLTPALIAGNARRINLLTLRMCTASSCSHCHKICASHSLAIHPHPLLA